jgi:hypothetical protein
VRFACSAISNSGGANCGEGRGDGRGFMAEGRPALECSRAGDPGRRIERAVCGRFSSGDSGRWIERRGGSGRAERVRARPVRDDTRRGVGWSHGPTHARLLTGSLATVAAASRRFYGVRHGHVALHDTVAWAK